MTADLMASRRHSLRCEAIGETFRIDVAWPEFGVAEGQALPVVYAMDGNTVFGIAAQAARFLQNAGEMPPVLMVGVGYDLGGERPRAAYGALRTRDLTPSLDQAFLDQMLAGQKGRPAPIETAPPMGGAEAFLDFLTGDLPVFLAHHYAVDLADQTLAGSSLGGLFSLHALMTRPGAFRRHIANSPSLWWRERELFAREAALAQTGADLPARLFLSIGGLETESPWDGVREAAHLARRLGGYPSLSLTYHVFEGESHASVIPAALSRGLRTVFT